LNISIFGLGYVGCVGLGCLSEKGHNIIGVDVDRIKVNLINSGKATIVEKDIDELIRKNSNAGKIKATTDFKQAVAESDAAIICVGTPNNENGHLDMTHINKVAEEIGEALKNKNGFFAVAIRSTVMPGTNKRIGEIIREKSGKKVNTDFGVVSNPEFLREGTAVEDFFNPPYTVIASDSAKAANIMKKVYKDISGDVILTDVGTAEMIKFVNNSYHGLKVVFANEVGRICKSLGVDSRKLMELFVKDQILNISPYYFKPGFSYGGSCLPKDLKALNSIAHDNYVNVPVLSSVENSNNIHIDYALNLILNKQKKKIGFYGVSFKNGTDDLRFSPALELAERLLGKGYNIKIYDKNVHLSRLMGKNKDYLFNKLPHINEVLIENLDDLVCNSELLIIVNKDKEISKLMNKDLSQLDLIDLARVTEDWKKLSKYDGICW
jgi:GDP-mannose 6-dehydrogenase